MVRQSVKIAGINGIALTKLDVLDGMDQLKIGVGYEYQGKFYDYYPAGAHIQASVKPIYEYLDGWSESTESMRSFKDLPANAIKYIRRIEELIETPVAIVSTSPKREDSILVKDPFMY
jgi:adenylosuccinate synthase